VLESIRTRLARLLAPKSIATRQYASARGSRLNLWGTSLNASADSELSTSLTALRTRSRKLMRDAPYAKRARTIVVNNVIGSGVGMQAQVKNSRGELHERINADIEEQWRQWSRADCCHTGGALAFQDLERACLSEVFTAGEVFIRKHYRTFGNSRVPIGLELVEAERVADEFTFPTPENQATRLGIERDEFGRPSAYYIRTIHPGEVRLAAGQEVRLERVPAADIYHLRVVDRWPMTRGEPWLHSVIVKLDNMDEYSAAELTAARMGANFFATLESDADDSLATATDASTGQRELNIEPGVIEGLSPGESLKFHTPNRPNTALDPFLRYMLREVAAGVGVSYESLSRDYSQSNYSSSRLALLDDRDLWRVLQQWWIRSFREPMLRDWMQAAVLSRAIGSIQVEAYAPDTERFLAVSWKLRGWSWVDPTKEVNAYKEAVKAGFTTISAVIAQTAGGVDIEDVIAERKRELDMLDAAGIDVDTTVEEPQEIAEPLPPTAAQLASPADDDGENQPARVFNLRN
jgi:lambda family phage portal protein